MTSITIGYGYIRPSEVFSMFIASLHVFIGFILLTIFTVIISRRYLR
ncbi:MAG: ion channel [Candidatus Hodarchaeota archaeon]